MDQILESDFHYRGPRGYSNYELAIQNGYKGTEAEWLEEQKQGAFLNYKDNFDEEFNRKVDLADTHITNKKNEALNILDKEIARVTNEQVEIDPNAEVIQARAGFNTLGSIIKQKIYHFENVQAMKNCISLVEGDVVETLGYYSENDGGGGKYKIRIKTSEDIEDKGIIHFLNRGLVAELIIENYITPEMFGAYGNAANDDTIALQKAINFSNKLKATKEYLITDTIVIFCELADININKIIYTGTDYAVRLERCENGSYVQIYEIDAQSGSCIELSAGKTSDDKDYLQYLKLSGCYLTANVDNGTCIEICNNSKWVNECVLSDFRLKKGKFGIHVSKGLGEVEHLSFSNIGFELTTFGAYLDNCNSFSFINCRLSENRHFITTRNTCLNLEIISSENVYLPKLILSDKTQGFMMAPVTDENYDYTLSHFYSIFNGKLNAYKHNSYANPNPADTTIINIEELYPTLRSKPTTININVKFTELILDNYYGTAYGINEIVLKMNETQSRSLIVKKGHSTIAVFGNEIPNYSIVILKWAPQFGWFYYIGTRCRVN